DGGEDRPCPAHIGERFGRILLVGIDVVAGAEFFRQFLLIAAAVDGDGTKALSRGKLDAQMAEAADSVDSDDVSRSCTSVAALVKGSSPGAEKRRKSDRVETARERSHRRCERSHVRRIAAVAAHPRHLVNILAGKTRVAPAMAAITARPAEPADAHALS